MAKFLQIETFNNEIPFVSRSITTCLSLSKKKNTSKFQIVKPQEKIRRTLYGSKARFWLDKWLINGDILLFHALRPIATTVVNYKSELDHSLRAYILVQIVSTLPPYISGDRDTIYWETSKTGMFSTKSVHKMIVSGSWKAKYVLCACFKGLPWLRIWACEVDNKGCYKPLVDSIRHLIQKDWSFKVHHIYKEANRVVDGLTSLT
ncbi:conserved hypothetical protein [Ricinus communis]|uniref:RNase H type-1 domain-containing protein n=1 Tax=Ricinus communis TaxID=3988 RepID=B9RXA7_RICCO|nr:conserved hypothetical protein [Ricinus communis]